MEGQTTRYRRAQPWTPTAADLQAVDGRYESTELGIGVRDRARRERPEMRFERAPDKSLELTPVERDTYMLRMMIVRFRRDASGKVTGFDYGNPVVRNIAFTRLGDRAVRCGGIGADSRGAGCSRRHRFRRRHARRAAARGSRGRVRARSRAHARDHARERPAARPAVGRREARADARLGHDVLRRRQRSSHSRSRSAPTDARRPR